MDALGLILTNIAHRLTGLVAWKIKLAVMTTTSCLNVAYKRSTDYQLGGVTGHYEQRG